MKKKILVIDDSLMVRAQVRQLLDPAVYEVVEAKDGVEGIAALRSTRDIALVMCDVTMPRMSGLDLLEELRSAAELPAPFVMLSAADQNRHVHHAKALGAVAWVHKPFKPDQLAALIEKLTTTPPSPEARAAVSSSA
jgi:two-component system chemotaxis response regulator CheY